MNDTIVCINVSRDQLSPCLARSLRSSCRQRDLRLIKVKPIRFGRNTRESQKIAIEWCVNISGACVSLACTVGGIRLSSLPIARAFSRHNTNGGLAREELISLTTTLNG